jgi:hypothetical protein
VTVFDSSLKNIFARISVAFFYTCSSFKTNSNQKYFLHSVRTTPIRNQGFDVAKLPTASRFFLKFGKIFRAFFVKNGLSESPVILVR